LRKPGAIIEILLDFLIPPASSSLRAVARSSDVRIPEAAMKKWSVIPVAMILALAYPAFATVVYFDDTFSDANWELTPFVNNAGSTSAAQVVTGGNADAYRRVTTSPGPSPAGHPAQILGFHKNLLATYAPGSLGAIAALDYSEDAIMLNGFGDGQASGPALQQDGKVYLRYAVFAKDANWTPKSFLGLTQDSFSLLNLTDTGIVDGTKHPDFSAAGSPITFGFFRFNATAATASGGGSYSIIAGIDNWRIAILPEPSSLLLLGLGLLGLIGRRRLLDRL
jgi:hypothetical protein